MSFVGAMQTSQATLAKFRNVFKLVVLLSAFTVCLLALQDIVGFRIPISKVFIPNQQQRTVDIVYEKCTKIPPPPKGMTWPEEDYIHDPHVTDVRQVADADRSRVTLHGKPEVEVGDTVRVTVELYDGFGKRRTKGGDLVRVWMKEPRLGASATANMTDNQDGSYTAILTAFWEGSPTVKAAIIAPREVIAIQFRRRYICPPVLMNTAIFEHAGVTEETPCNFDPQIPDYPSICNFTGTNYGSPWYCGKPRTPGLLCHDWSKISDVHLVDTEEDRLLLSTIDRDLTTLKYKTRLIPTNISLAVRKDKQHVTRVQVLGKCNKVKKDLTWSRSHPTGYLYNRKWVSRHCSGQPGNYEFKSCLQNTKVVLIGDSTVRQLFDGLKRRFYCEWLTGAGLIADKSLKHRPGICINEALNYTLEMDEHTLPFCTSNTPRTYLRTFAAHLDLIRGEENYVVILHGFAHFLNYHSHVFYETLQNMKKGIVNLLNRKSNVFIFIKGPHTYSFARNEDSVMWMPDRYADYYQQFIYDTFSDLRDRVMFLECQDITISTEQWHIHAEDFIIDALVNNVFSHVCSY